MTKPLPANRPQPMYRGALRVALWGSSRAGHVAARGGQRTDDIERALAFERRRHYTAEFDRLTDGGGRRGSLRAQHALAVRRRDDAPQMQRAVMPHRVARERH